MVWRALLYALKGNHLKIVRCLRLDSIPLELF